jgi:integrase
VAALLKRGQPRRYGDGGNLYLKISGRGTGSWVWMTKTGGKQSPMGLGSVRDISLAEARELAEACRAARRHGLDPKSALANRNGGVTFGDVARELIATMAAVWRSKKHTAQWHMTLLGEMPPRPDGTIVRTENDYCAAIRGKPIASITTEDALRVLRSIWNTRPATASRVRGRCEAVIDAARARGLVTGENVFRWRGHLAALLPPPTALTHGNHHRAMPYTAAPEFMATLRTKDTVAARALEFTVLTAARTGEVLGATWAELDWEAQTWTVPAVRMKAGRDHVVPLSGRALQILDEMQQARRSEFIFVGRRGHALSHAALIATLRRTGAAEATVHGFRSSFRDWCGDRTEHPREVAEAALGHAIGSRVEQAYRRSSALEKRRKLMQAWNDFLAQGTGATIATLPTRRRA